MDPIAEAHEALIPSVPLLDPTQLPARRWCAGSREDPLTGLIAFPDFHNYLPHRLVSTLYDGGLVGLAIGDVDGLKAHVEAVNSSDPASFGHLAGNRVMARLGMETRAWFRHQPWDEGCVATFGGDEVIIAAAIGTPHEFVKAIGDLRDTLAMALPVPVSFGLTVVGPEHLPAERAGDTWPHPFTDALLASVDRCLFAHKAARRSRGAAGGIVAITEPPWSAHRTSASATYTFVALPERPEHIVHSIARRTGISSEEILLLPYVGPPGLRGSSFRVAIGDAKPTTQVIISVHGQAALADPADHEGAAVVVTIQPTRAALPAQVPVDLATALTDRGASWAALPTHEQSQLLHLIRESSTSDVRTQRIAAAVAAAEARTRTSP